MKIDNLEVYDILLDENSEYQGMVANSLVETPAIEVNFLKFSKETNMKFSVDEDERIVFGATLVPDLPIFRRGQNGNADYYVKFSKETIKQIAIKFFKDNQNTNVTVNHSFPTHKAVLFQSIIIDDKQKIKTDMDLPNGSWLTGYKIYDDVLWNDIKSGKINGFSVELYSDIAKDSLSKEVSLEEQIISLIDKVIAVKN